MKNKNTYFIYTILFIFIVICVFAIFFINNYSFIWQSDGLKQHYIILKNFNETIKNYIANPSNGIDLFSWSMGLGLDVIGQYSYYALGDPFAYISLLFPIQYLEYTYSFLILLRMYCIGLAFIVYAKNNCKYILNSRISNYNLVIGAIIYTFCAFTLFAGIRHPYFLNAMILFPLLLMGTDKLLEENKKTPLTIFVAISAISNYYFFYMHTVMTIIYAFIYYMHKYKNKGFKAFLKKLASGALCYIIGILIAGIILFPTAYAFINSARSGEETVCKYSTDYYKSLFTINLLTAYGDNWSFIGVSSIILLMLPILWARRKKYLIYFIYFIIATIILLVPFLGSAMNGFSYPNNRWSFIYSFILAYIVTLCLEKNYTKTEVKLMCLFLFLYAICAIFAILYIKSSSCLIIYLIQIAIAFIMLIAILYQNYVGIYKIKTIDLFKSIILIFIICNILIMSYGLYSSYDRNYAEQFIKIETCDEELASQLGENKSYEYNIKNIIKTDNSFYRIAKVPHIVQNLSVCYGYSSTECFLSLGNKYVYNLNQELADNLYSSVCNIKGLGDRTKITTLLGTKYYVTDNNYKKYLPYGYSLKEENNGVYTYQNKYALSIGVCYLDYMLRSTYEKLNPIQKEDALLKTAVIENANEIEGLNIKEKNDWDDILKCYEDISYKIVDKDKILQDNGNSKTVIVNKENQSIEVEIPNIKDSELYVYISDFEFSGNDAHKITAKFKEKNVCKSIDNKITSAYYQKSPEILLNLGYYEKANGKIKLIFSTKGEYKFKSLQILSVPMNNFEETIKEIKNNELKDVTCNNKEIKGKVSLEQDGILQISTSYTTGWKAYIDGKEANTINVNTAFIGIPVKKGEHSIYLKYEVPYLKIGITCSIIGLISLVILTIYELKKN